MSITTIPFSFSVVNPFITIDAPPDGGSVVAGNNTFMGIACKNY